MTTVKTTYDDASLASEPIARDRTHEPHKLLGQVMVLVAVAVGFAAACGCREPCHRV
jgi:hypothetical protein